MKNRKILIVVISTLLLVTIVGGIVYAAYTFNRKIDVDSTVGIIEIDSKNFRNYAAQNNYQPSDANYRKQSKLRKDTVLVLDGISFTSISTYVETGDRLYIKNKVYYTRNGNNYEIFTDYEVGTVISITLFEEVKTYNGIRKIDIAYDKTLNNIAESAISIDTNVITLNLSPTITINCTIDSTKGIITGATVTATGRNYRVVVDSDGQGLVVLDSDITSSSSSGYSILSADEHITCNANENKKTENNIYLSQLGLEFTFTSEIAVYIRIHFEDAWKRTRSYTSTEKENYILKDQVDGVSPFAVADNDWYYDADTNYAYLKTMYVPTQDQNGNYNSQSYVFNVNEAYFYNVSTSTAYTEYIEVEVSFTVDIVQANRAAELWKVDLDTILAS